MPKVEGSKGREIRDPASPFHIWVNPYVESTWVGCGLSHCMNVDDQEMQFLIYVYFANLKMIIFYYYTNLLDYLLNT